MKRFCLVLLTVALTLSMLFVVAAASSTLYISKQPMDQFVKPGKTATFEVVAVGDGLTYQWNTRAAGSTVWNTSVYNGNSAVYQLEGTKARDGFSVRCVVTDSSGNSVTSRVCKLYVGSSALELYGSQGLSFVLEWISSVCKALFAPDGVLFPLIGVLAVGIAVSALLLGIKVIRSFSWGA